MEKYTTCYMCACRCGIKVTLNPDDSIRFIQGNPNHPINKGVLCAKGNAGIMKQNSPAKLHSPLLRKKNALRGEGEFESISWEHALNILTKRLAKIRATNPNQLAYFTGRDQMQALTGLWATQFGTQNWAAHGGFCSVNIAAAGLYTLGYSFWEFGEPDWDRSNYFMLWGVAEDHSSNPIKIGLNKLKQRGAKIVVINPAASGYHGLADEWVPIRPGTDGLLALSLIYVLIKNNFIDIDYLTRYTNGPWLVQEQAGSNQGLFWRNAQGKPMIFNTTDECFMPFDAAKTKPALIGEFISPDGAPLNTSAGLLVKEYKQEKYAPAKVAAQCGIKAETIERLAFELAEVAFNQTITINTPWTDWQGNKQTHFIGRPVSMHAMRGIAAHSNGFDTTRAIHLLQTLLGSIDCPGGFRSKAPFPRPIPPNIKPAKTSTPNTPLSSPPLGFPTKPEDLVINQQGEPLRIDKAYSWDAPLANHGLMHMVITNAYHGDPYPIDTLLIFMANMAWNSTMNPLAIIEMLKAKDSSGNYKIPFLVVVDAFNSEMVQYADLVLPDTTFLERHDCISLLDRPISDPDALCDAIRLPVVKCNRDVRPWQEVMLDLAYRLKFPAFVNLDGSAKYKNYQNFVINFEKSPGVGFLAGWRGKDHNTSAKGEPNPQQWQAYENNQSFFLEELPPNLRFYKGVNQDYLEWAHEKALIPKPEPILVHVYSEILQTFKLAGQGLYDGPTPQTTEHQTRLKTYFNPLPTYYEPLEWSTIDTKKYPLHAVTQRPMMMYHSWDSQNAWLRQIINQNFLYMNIKTGESLGLQDETWVWIESIHARARVPLKLIQGCQEDTVWTWNAIAKQAGTWGLSKQAPESQQAFLMNHLIRELLPQQEHAQTNSDPITGQAAWYDCRVRVYATENKRVAGVQYELLTQQQGETTCA